MKICAWIWIGMLRFWIIAYTPKGTPAVDFFSGFFCVGGGETCQLSWGIETDCQGKRRGGTVHTAQSISIVAGKPSVDFER